MCFGMFRLGFWCPLGCPGVSLTRKKKRKENRQFVDLVKSCKKHCRRSVLAGARHPGRREKMTQKGVIIPWKMYDELRLFGAVFYDFKGAFRRPFWVPGAASLSSFF